MSQISHDRFVFDLIYQRRDLKERLTSSHLRLQQHQIAIEPLYSTYDVVGHFCSIPFIIVHTVVHT